MGWVWAGAVPGQILSDWGADVIKVESSRRLDPARQGRPIIGDKPDPEQNSLHHNVNRGKRSVTIDITTEAGAGLVKALVATADIVIENMSPHALAAAGLNYAALREVNPRIIMVSQPLAGQTGPYSNLRGYGPSVNGLTGLDYITGYEGSEQFAGFNHNIGDANVAMFAVVGLMAALRRREHTGQGEYIDLSMWEALTAHQAIGLLDFQMNGRRGQPRGHDHPLYSPYGIYRCQDDDVEEGWIAIVVETDTEWRSLCEAMGRAEWLADDRFSSHSNRRKHRDELDASITEWTRGWNKFELEQFLQDRDIAGTACRNAGDRYLDTRLREWGTYVDVEHPVLGVEPLYGNPVRMERHKPPPLRRAPLLGEHNRQVLQEILGMSEEEVTQLEADGVLR